MKSDLYNEFLVFSLEMNGIRAISKDKIRGLFADLIIMDELTVQANPVKKNEPWYRKQGKQRC